MLDSKDLKKLADKFDLNSVILFATAPHNETHIVIFGKTPEAEDVVHQLSIRLQEAIGWPPSPSLIPNRIRQQQEKIARLEAEIAELIKENENKV